MPRVNLESQKKVSFDHQLNRQTLSGRERAGERELRKLHGGSSFNTLESSTRPTAWPTLSGTVLNKASQSYKDLSSAEAHARSPCLVTGI